VCSVGRGPEAGVSANCNGRRDISKSNKAGEIKLSASLAIRKVVNRDHEKDATIGTGVCDGVRV